MSERQSPNANDNLENTNPQSNPSVNDIAQVVDDKPKTPNKESNPDPIKQEPINVIVNVPQPNENGIKTADKIAILALIVSAFLAWYTFGLFKKTKDSVDIAQKSLEDSRLNAKADSIRNSKIDSISKKERDNAYKKDSILLRLTKQSLQSQIASLNQTQKRFDIESRPIVEITDLKVDSILAGRYAVVTYNIRDAGKLPAIIVSVQGQTGFGRLIALKDLKKTISTNRKIINLDISSTTAATQRINTKTITQDDITHFYSGDGFFFIFIEVNYMNFVTKQKYRHSSIWKLNWVKEQGPDWGGMELKDIPLKKF